MWADLKSLFCHPETLALAKRELQEAQRGALQAQSAREHAEALANFNEKRVNRLKRYIQEMEAA